MSSARLGHFLTSLKDFTKLSVSNAQEENYSTECSLSGNTGLILSQSFFRVSWRDYLPLGKTLLLAFALLHSVLQDQICLLLQVFLDFLLLHSSPLYWKGHPFWVLVLKGLVSLHRTVQLQLPQPYWLGHRLGLVWYWMVCLGNEQRSFCCFWDFIQVRHFGLLLTMMATPFLLRDSCPQ